MSRPVRRAPRRAPARTREIDASQIVFSGRSIKWIVGLIGTALVAIIGWLTLWDRVDARWRHESVQAAQDRAIAAEIAAAREKAASDTKALGA